VIAFAQWLSTTPFSIAIQSRTWLIALLQAIHILTIGFVFVSMLMYALRVLGRIRVDESLEAVWARFAGWLWGGIAVMAFTGILLIVGEPVRQASALSFWLKMTMIIIGVTGLLVLRRTASRVLAVGVILVWIAIIFLGRAIAYDLEVWESWHLGA
jgi:uncharacterized membrane protein SirB2